MALKKSQLFLRPAANLLWFRSFGKSFFFHEPDSAHLLSHWGGLCSGRAAQPRWLWASFTMVTPDGQSGGLSTLFWILALLQSQGDSRRVRIPLQSNLSKAVKESQHRWSHGGPAWKKKKVSRSEIYLQNKEDGGRRDRSSSLVGSTLLYLLLCSLFISVTNRVKQAGQASCVSSDYFSNLHLRSQCDSMGYSSPLMSKSNLHSHRGCFMNSCSVIEPPCCKY